MVDWVDDFTAMLSSVVEEDHWVEEPFDLRIDLGDLVDVDLTPSEPHWCMGQEECGDCRTQLRMEAATWLHDLSERFPMWSSDVYLG